MAEAQYFLSSHTYLCPTDYHWILLDVNKDRYLCIHRREFDALAPWLHETQDRVRAKHTGDIPSAAAALASQLIEQGLLTRNAENARSNSRLNLRAPVDTLPPTKTLPGTLASALHAPAFLFAAARADYLLRRRPFARIVASVAGRKARLNATASGFDFTKATRLVAIFDVLRPIYPRDYLCMFDSLALVEFLAVHSLFPDWAFGVTADPFQAHCWVQAASMVLNDSVERASAYNPIMSV